MVNKQNTEKQRNGHGPQQDGLVLSSAPHVIVGVIGKLENMRALENLVFRCVSVLGGVLEEDRVGVGWDIFMGINGN